jgi:hypothetical protein
VKVSMSFINPKYMRKSYLTDSEVQEEMAEGFFRGLLKMTRMINCEIGESFVVGYDGGGYNFGGYIDARYIGKIANILHFLRTHSVLVSIKTNYWPAGGVSFKN